MSLLLLSECIILTRPGGDSQGEVSLHCDPRNYLRGRSHLPQPWAHLRKPLHLCDLLTPQAVSEVGRADTHLLDVCDVHQLDHLVPL